MRTTVRCGLDRLGDSTLVAGRRVALLAHPASVDSELRHAEEVLTAAGARLVSRLGPEHGYGGHAQDMEGVDENGEQDGPPIYSLYGHDLDSLRPTEAMLGDAEILVVDLQDVGARYYTFVWTAALCLEVCHRLGVELLVLDRPNPLGGVAVEGPPIEGAYHSFVGHHDVPNRHGMTIAEMLALYAADHHLSDALQRLPAQGLTRQMGYHETGLPWVLPSPNMPTVETAVVYPGMCLIEGTNLSEGRGTTRPFELVGAPWIDGDVLAGQLRAYDLPGVRFRPVTFKPMFQKHEDQLCGGVQLHVTDVSRFEPFKVGVAVLLATFQTWPEQTSWRGEAYEFVEDLPAIDLLAGGHWLREGVEAGRSLREISAPWRANEEAFLERRRPHLLY